MKYTIFDLDNCISNDVNRHSLLPDYDAYHSKCMEDEIDLSGIQKVPENILIFTGRPNKYREQTLKWIKKSWFAFTFDPFMLMRPIGNTFPSADLKQYFLFLMVKNGFNPQNIEVAYDDRQDVLNMYGRYGIKTVLKRINEYTE